MSATRELLLRYLRQQAELGNGIWFLESLTVEELRAALRRDPDWPTRTGDAASAELATSPRSRLAEPVAGYAAAAPLDVLRAEACVCTRCRLAETRRQVVFGEGSSTADVVVVGEAPGGEEDRTGRPFVGRAGKLLDLLLLSVGFPRDRVFICNVLKCRPPNNRDPLADEVSSCAPYLRRQIELIDPRVLLAVGRFAAQSLCATDEPMSRLRGSVRSYGAVPVVATYHPAYLLRSPDAVRSAWQDFQLLRRVHDERVLA
ncbi:MAG: uracil-DNA glycosylase [Longimicrobiales bacterium]